jgi:integrase
MRQKGRNFYYVFPGKPEKWEPLGADLDKALRQWAELRAAGGERSRTVGELVQFYLDRETRSANTTKQYRSYLKAILADFTFPAKELTSQHVAVWREANGKRKSYCNGVIALILAAARIGQELGWCGHVAVKKWQEDGRDRVLEPAEFVRIRAKAVELGLHWLKIMMDIGYLTGARPVDIIALTWAKANEDLVAIRQQKTKTRQEFVKSEALAQVFNEAKVRPILGLYVVATANGRPVTRNMYDNRWRQVCEVAGVADAQFRDIRPMAANAAEEDGQDIQKLLGHASMEMSQHYLKKRRTVKAETVRKLI